MHASTSGILPSDDRMVVPFATSVLTSLPSLTPTCGRSWEGFSCRLDRCASSGPAALDSFAGRETEESSRIALPANYEYRGVAMTPLTFPGPPPVGRVRPWLSDPAVVPGGPGGATRDALPIP